MRSAAWTRSCASPSCTWGRGLSELEEGWLVRSLYREDGLTQPQIAQRMGRHKSWVLRRLMLVESLLPDVQAQVHAPGTVPSPRGGGCEVGCHVETRWPLVAGVLDADETARDVLLAGRLHTPATGTIDAPEGRFSSPPS